MLLLCCCSRVAYLALCLCLCDRRREKPKRHNPRFTAPFVIRLEVGDPWKPDDSAIEQGLRLVKDSTRGDRANVVVKLWTEDGMFHGILHRRGEPMLTWQVMAGKYIVTYDMIAHPEYTAVQASILDARDKVNTAVTAAVSPL